MSTPRFFIDVLVSGQVTLSQEEAQHALRARRLSAGDAVILFDGRGHESDGRIAAASRRDVVIEAGEVRFRDRPRPRLTLAFAPPKEPKQDILIEKCTELGVAAFVPLVCERAVAGVSDHRLDKWRKRTIEAAKQSGQCWLPELLAPRTLTQALSDRESYGGVLACLSAGDDIRPEPMADVLAAVRERDHVLVFVGPEGGWEPDEVSCLLAAGATPVSLGPNVLRIETAAIAMAAMVHALARSCGS